MNPTVITDPYPDTAALPAMSSTQNGSTDMNMLNESLAREQMSARLGEAQQLRLGHQLTRARRLSRKAERAAQQARLALARAL